MNETPTDVNSFELQEPNLEKLLELPADVAKLFDESVPHEVNDANLDKLVDDLKEMLRERFNYPKSEQEIRVLRFSSLGQPDKRLWFINQDPEIIAKENLSLKQGMTFLLGDLIEKVLCFLFREAGHTVEAEQQQVEVDGVKGHVDAVVDGIVVDLKTAHPFFYPKLLNLDDLMSNDTFGYLAQLGGYANVLTPGEGAAFIPLNKSSGEFAITYVPADIVKQFDPVPRVAHLKKILAKTEPPKVCLPPQSDGKSGNMVLNDGCKFCPCKTKCHPNLRAFQYSNGVKYFTSVVKPPKVPEVPLDND